MGDKAARIIHNS